MSAQDLEHDIRRTRADVSLTLYALEQKLAARYLVQKGFDMFKDMLGSPEALNDGLNRGLTAMRANPVPVALIGLGAAWLIAANSGMADRIANDERVTAARRRVADFAGDVGNRAGELASSVAERVGLGGTTDAAALGHPGNPSFDQGGRPAASDGWVHQMTDMAQGALRSARDSGGAMLNRAGDYASGPAGRVADQLAAAFERHPLAIGAAGLMAGALLGALLPTTAVEDEWLGGTRDELLQKAEQAGEAAVSRVRDIAVQAADAAADAAAGSVKTATDRMTQG